MQLSLSYSAKRWPLVLTIGLLSWLLFGLWALPLSPFSIHYVQFLLVAAPLWVVPLAWNQLYLPVWAKTFALPAGVAFALAFLLAPGIWAAALVLPWLILTVAIAVKKVRDWFFYRKTDLSTLCLLAANVYLPVGAAWAFADRLAFQPLDFSPTITLLTAVHFHYAGFALLVITGFAMREFPCVLGKMIAWGAILGISLVAGGIMSTHFGGPAYVEIATVSVMALSGMGVGMMHLNLAWRHRKESGIQLWILAGLALFIGMLLALGYGWRTVFPLEMLTIPWMYAVHGTLNAVGFAVPALLGWWGRS